jgi:hypothetical protein
MRSVRALPLLLTGVFSLLSPAKKREPLAHQTRIIKRYLTRIVSPRNSCKVSIVAGFSVATAEVQSASITIDDDLSDQSRTRVVVSFRFIDDKTVWTARSDILFNYTRQC